MASAADRFAAATYSTVTAEEPCLSKKNSCTQMLRNKRDKAMKHWRLPMSIIVVVVVVVRDWHERANEAP